MSSNKPEVNKEWAAAGTPAFGDYVWIEQKRFGVDNEMYRFKVVDSFQSNTTEEIPMSYKHDMVHHEMTPCLRVVVDGIAADDVQRVRVDQVRMQKGKGPEKKLPQLSDSQNERLAVLAEALQVAGVEIDASSDESITLSFERSGSSYPFTIEYCNSVNSLSIFDGRAVKNGK